jgi:hypothetical protein
MHSHQQPDTAPLGAPAAADGNAPFEDGNALSLMAYPCMPAAIASINKAVPDKLLPSGLASIRAKYAGSATYLKGLPLMCKSTAVRVAILVMAADWLIVKHMVSA